MNELKTKENLSSDQEIDEQKINEIVRKLERINLKFDNRIKGYGFSDPEEKEIILNLKRHKGDINELLNTFWHEALHIIGYDEDETIKIAGQIEKIPYARELAMKMIIKALIKKISPSSKVYKLKKSNS